jgi:hypothetical protein
LRERGGRGAGGREDGDHNEADECQAADHGRGLYGTLRR